MAYMVYISLLEYKLLADDSFIFEVTSFVLEESTSTVDATSNLHLNVSFLSP